MSRSSNYHGGKKRSNCYFCGAFGTEEHHVIPQRFGGPDNADNVVGVCNPCHKKLERLYDKEFYEYFGVKDEKGVRRFHTRCQWNDCTDQAKEHWRNIHTGLDIYICGDHDVVELWESKRYFELKEVADE